jgi:putative membrane protein
VNLRAYRTFQALVLAGLGIFLFAKVMNGRILFYINQRFVILVLLAALALILLAQFILRERPALQQVEDSPHHDHSGEDDPHGNRAGWALWLLALPVLIGLLAPERPLGAGALGTRGINMTSTYTIQGGSTSALAISPTQRSVLDWIRAVNEEPDQTVLDGQPADVTGFVYHDARLERDQFMVARFSIACCVADAAALGMVVDWPESASLPDNQWVRVRGLVHLAQLDDRTIAVIDAMSVYRVPEPVQPYLFP